MPTSRGSSHDDEFSAGSPRRANAVVNLAADEEKRMSQTNAWISPMPAAAPLIAPTIGLGICRGSVIGQRRRLAVGVPPAAAASACMSRPGQNDRPAPVTTIVRTSAFAAASTNAWK